MKSAFAQDALRRLRRTLLCSTTDLRAGDVALKISGIVDSVLIVLLHGIVLLVIHQWSCARQRPPPHSARHAKHLRSVAVMAVTIAMGKVRIHKSVIVIAFGKLHQHLEAFVEDVSLHGLGLAVLVPILIAASTLVGNALKS